MLVLALIVLGLFLLMHLTIVSDGIAPDDAVRIHFLFLGFIILMVLVFVAAHSKIRRLLVPITLLKRGVDAVADGDYDIDIPVRSKDELADLSLAFNRMASRLKETIQAKDQLLMDVSHELKTPVTRLMIAVALLPDAGLRESMNEDLRELESMINELLEAERMRAGLMHLDLQAVDVVRLVRECSASFREGQPGVILRDLPQALTLSLDPGRIRIVIRNVLANAMTYSRVDSRPVEISAIVDEKQFMLFISDDGIGVPHDEVEKVFQPFYRVDKSRSKGSGGHGLGLNLCRNIVEAHGGSITLRNNQKRGVTLSISLPLA